MNFRILALLLIFTSLLNESSNNTGNASKRIFPLNLLENEKKEISNTSNSSVSRLLRALSGQKSVKAKSKRKKNEEPTERGGGGAGNSVGSQSSGSQLITIRFPGNTKITLTKKDYQKFSNNEVLRRYVIFQHESKNQKNKKEKQNKKNQHDKKKQNNVNNSHNTNNQPNIHIPNNKIDPNILGNRNTLINPLDKIN